MCSRHGAPGTPAQASGSAREGSAAAGLESVPDPVRTIAILGAGELGAGLAARLARRALARRVVLVDPDQDRARGLALDLRQAGALDGADTVLEGTADLRGAGVADVVVVADSPAVAAGETSPERARSLVDEWRAGLASAVLVVATADGATLVEAAVARGLPRERVLGSSPVAFAAALRRRIAVELGVGAGGVSATVCGSPPARPVIPGAALHLAGMPADRLEPAAIRRAVASLGTRPPGPRSLAAAAAWVVGSLQRPLPSVASATVALAGEYGHRGIALAVPARLGRGGVEEVLEWPLSPVERVAFDNAAARRQAAAAPPR
jgi:malate dehydrogenase